ncbi:preprotein translocase subunit SecG [Brevundimonas aurantiaca]|uniref:preprotein translocase subunit SecG n=2 Tax=Brevundimonas aurantiaca TaxID=74316 RepID=UPI001F30CD7B|nr:preprotein translocase subunit SecG [Brevundimonas aurantiaca]
MLQTILLVAIILVAVSLTGVVLLQRSEGGALGMGGGPSGFMTARGAGNLLTKVTWVLAALLFGLTIILTVVGNMDRASTSVIDADAVGSLATTPRPQQQQPAQAQPPPRPTVGPVAGRSGSQPAVGGAGAAAGPHPGPVRPRRPRVPKARRRARFLLLINSSIRRGPCVVRESWSKVSAHGSLCVHHRRRGFLAWKRPRFRRSRRSSAGARL